MDINLANGLKEVTDLITRINDNETHLMQLLCKYIKNPQLHKDLCKYLRLSSEFNFEFS